MKKEKTRKAIAGLGISIFLLLAFFSTAQLFASASVEIAAECPTKGDECNTNANCGNQNLCYCNTATHACANLHAATQN